MCFGNSKGAERERKVSKAGLCLEILEFLISSENLGTSQPGTDPLWMPRFRSAYSDTRPAGNSQKVLKGTVSKTQETLWLNRTNTSEKIHQGVKLGSSKKNPRNEMVSTRSQGSKQILSWSPAKCPEAVGSLGRDSYWFQRVP